MVQNFTLYITAWSVFQFAYHLALKFVRKDQSLSVKQCWIKYIVFPIFLKTKFLANAILFQAHNMSINDDFLLFYEKQVARVTSIFCLY